jgi:hypothetical protein
MREATGDIWTFPSDAIAITTNGDVNGKGLAVMGRGVALQAAERFPDLRTALAESLRLYGNVVNCWDPYLLGAPQPDLGLLLEDGEPRPTLPYVVSFPVKAHWREPARPDLIRTSCLALREMIDVMGWDCVVLPRPGCGNGGLAWDDVRPILMEIIGDDDRVVVVDRAPS